MISRDPHGRLRVARSLLDPTAVADVVGTTYGLAPSACTLHRSFTHDVYRVTCDAGVCYAKVYGPRTYSPQEIAYEADLVRHLAASGVPVATMIAARDGSLVQRLHMIEGERFLVLWSNAPGAPVRPPCAADVYGRYGRAAASLHRAADGFTSPHERGAWDLNALLERPLAAIAPYLAERPRDWEGLGALAERLRGRMRAFAAAGLDWGPCHGDLTLDAFHVDRGGRITFYDFESCGPGWRAVELQGVFAHAAASNWDAFRDAYTSVRPLGPVDIAALPWCVALYEISNMGWAASGWAGWSGQWRVQQDYWDERMQWLRRWDRDRLGGAAWT